jgi:O-antigen/teichoic acid export membrane protein
MIKKSLLGFLLQGIGSVIAFLAQFYLAKKFGASEFGKFNYYFGIIGFISIFLIYGFQYSVSKYKNEIDTNQDTLNSFSILSIVVLPVALIYFYLNNYNIKIIALLIVGVFSFSLLEIFRIIYTVNFKSNRAIFLKTWLFNVLFLLIALILNSHTKLTDQLLIALVISSSVISVPIFLFKKIKVSISIDFLKKSFPFFIIQLCYTSHLYLSKIIPSNYHGYEIIAGISIAILVSRVISLIGSTSSFILMPYFSDLFNKNRVNEVIDSYKEIRSINTSLIIPLFTLIITYSKQILSLIGQEYNQYNLILIIICTGSIFPIILGPNGTVILMTKSFKKEINSGLILICTFLIISLLFGSINILIIPFAFALAEILASFYKAYIVKKIFNFSLDYILFTKILLAISLNFILFYFTSTLEPSLIFYFSISIILFLSICLNMVILTDKKNKVKYQTKINDFCNSFKL